MHSIRRLEKLSQVELESLVLKLQMRGFKEVTAREPLRLPEKHFFRQRAEDLHGEAGETGDWIIVWSEPLFE